MNSNFSISPRWMSRDGLEHKIGLEYGLEQKDWSRTRSRATHGLESRSRQHDPESRSRSLGHVSISLIVALLLQQVYQRLTYCGLRTEISRFLDLNCFSKWFHGIVVITAILDRFEIFTLPREDPSHYVEYNCVENWQRAIMSKKFDIMTQNFDIMIQVST